MNEEFKPGHRYLTLIGLCLMVVGISLSVLQWKFGWTIPFVKQYSYRPSVHIDAEAKLGGIPGPEHVSPIVAIVHIDADKL